MAFTDRSSPSGPASSFSGTVTLDHGNIAANTTLSATVAVAGLTTDHVVALQPAANLPAGIAIAYARPSAAGILTIALANVTVGAIDPPAITYAVLATRTV